MQANITDLEIRSLKPRPGAPQEVWDKKQPGLLLRAYASGRLVWFVRATTREGKKTRPKLGEWPGIGVADARKLARQHLAAIHQGADPVGERRGARAARDSALSARTVHAATREWIAFHTAHPTKPWSATYARNVESALRVHLPRKLSDRPPRETTREEWTALITGVRDAAPGAAAFLYTVCGSFMGHAEAKGWIDHHLFPRKGRDHVAPHPAPRERVLADWEWAAIWKAAEQEPPKLRAFVRLLILTLARKSEPAGIASGEIGPGRDLWTIPGSRTKNKLDHTVPLCDLARAELAAVWPDRGGGAGDGWRLLGRAPGSGFSGYGRLLDRLKARSGVVDWSWHDMRRAGRTTLTHLRVPETDAEAALNHVSGRSRLDRTYNHAEAAPAAIRALQAWQSYVADILAARKAPGDAERLWRAGLPEHMRRAHRRPAARPKKAKPGPKRRPPACVPSVGVGTSVPPR